MRMPNNAMGILSEYYENAMVILCVYFGKYYRSVANALGIARGKP